MEKERQCRICGQLKNVTHGYRGDDSGMTKAGHKHYWCRECEKLNDAFTSKKARANWRTGQRASWNFEKGNPLPDRPATIIRRRNGN